MTDNEKYVNKYLQVLKSRHDGMLNDMINLETQYNLMKEILEENQATIQQLNAKVVELEEKLKKPARSTTSKAKTEKEDSF